jgi:hypothetical protein
VWGVNVGSVIKDITAGFENLPDFLGIAFLRVQETFLGAGAELVAFGTNLKNLGMYIVGNWRELVTDGFNAILTAASNFGSNVAKAFQAVKDVLTGGEWKFDATPLLEGFKATAAELPTYIKPVYTSFDEQVNERLLAIGQRIEGSAKSVGAAAGEAGKAAAAAATSTTSDIPEKTYTATEALLGLEKRLKEQITTWDMASNEAEIYKLKLAGISDAELADAKAMARKLDGLEKSKSIMKELAGPFYEYRERLKDIAVAEKDGGLSAVAADQARKKAKFELIEAMQKERGEAGALLAGSKEAYSAVLKQRRNDQVAGLNLPRLLSAVMPPSPENAPAQKKQVTETKAPAAAAAEKSVTVQSEMLTELKKIGAKLGEGYATLQLGIPF